MAPSPAIIHTSIRTIGKNQIHGKHHSEKIVIVSFDIQGKTTKKHNNSKVKQLKYHAPARSFKNSAASAP